MSKFTNEKLQINKVLFGDIEHRVEYLKGRVLTIIDSAISNEIQNKATKDLIKTEICHTVNELWKIAIGERKSIYQIESN